MKIGKDYRFITSSILPNFVLLKLRNADCKYFIYSQIDYPFCIPTLLNKFKFTDSICSYQGS